MTQKNSVTFSSKPNHAARQAHMQARQMFSEYDTSQIAPKKSKLPVIFGGLIAVVVVLAVVGLVMHFFADSGNGSDSLLPQGQSATVTVVAGDDAELVAASLYHAHLIADPDAFIRRCRVLGAESSLQAGTYVIEGGTSMDDIIAILKKGPGMTGLTLVVPEGTSLARIAADVETVTEGRITAEDFIAATTASRWTSEFAFTQYAGTGTLEGMLFPATYALGTATTADDLVRSMLTKFQTEVKDLDLSYPTQMGLSWYQWLIMASIVQAESQPGTEGTVASVFYNRINAKMPLQSDATSAYSVGGLPTPEDLANYEDPYNTYSYDRLGVCIPTPIGNPGLEALQAACSPEKTDYLYFYGTTRDGKPVTIFSRTYAEHQAAIAADN